MRHRAAADLLGIGERKVRTWVGERALNATTPSRACYSGNSLTVGGVTSLTMLTPRGYDGAKATPVRRAPTAT